MNAIFLPFMNLFTGRLTRSQYYKAVVIELIILFLGPFITVVPISWIFKYLQMPQDILNIVSPLMLLTFYVFAVVIGISIHVRRLHDSNRSGYNAFFIMVPIMNIVLLYWLWLAPSNEQKNKYGDKLNGKIKISTYILGLVK